MDDYLQELCESSLLFSWVDEDGTAQVFPMTAPTLERGVDFILKATDVEHGMLGEPSRSPVDEVVTDFIFKFSYNPVRDEFDEQLVCSPDDVSDALGAEYQSLCAWAKYNAGGVGEAGNLRAAMGPGSGHGRGDCQEAHPVAHHQALDHSLDL